MVLIPLERFAQVHGYPKSILSVDQALCILVAVCRWARGPRLDQTSIDSGKPWQIGSGESPFATLKVAELQNKQW